MARCFITKRHRWFIAILLATLIAMSLLFKASFEEFDMLKKNTSEVVQSESEEYQQEGIPQDSEVYEDDVYCTGIVDLLQNILPSFLKC